jgi:PAS domain S-box-containing protein
MYDPTHSNEPLRMTGEIRDDVVLQVVLNSVVDYAVFNLDPQGRITTWTQAAERLKGYRADEVIGRHFEMLYLPEDRESGQPHRNLQRAADNGAVQVQGLRLRKDGTTFEADVTISAVRDAEHRLVGFVKIVRDVTESKANEKRIEELTEELQQKVLTQTAQLQAANEDLEGFCYSIAHDLRAPLRAIIANARLLEEDCGESVGDQGREYMTRLATAGRRVSDLVDDLLSFARVGRHGINRQPVDVTRIARQVVEGWRGGCQGATARFEIDEGMAAEADAELVGVVLENLVSNACKYSRRGVCIHIGHTQIGDDRVFFVQDDGVGFDMRYHEKLFRPFERLHLDEEYEGTGIGLANVKRIVGRHGGKIWAQSAPGKGATFFFTLAASAERPHGTVETSAFGLR